MSRTSRGLLFTYGPILVMLLVLWLLAGNG
jgi:hypothetical protein